jgi:hypothetical protein
MTDEVLTRTRFQAGDKIPPWLLDIEPFDATATRGTLTFGTMVDVIDLPDYFVVMPLGMGELPPVVFFDGSSCKVFASAKNVRIPLASTCFVTPDQNCWKTQDQSPGVQFAPPPGLFDAHIPPQGFAGGQAEREMQRPEMQQLKALNDHRNETRASLWKRIKAVFRP